MDNEGSTALALAPTEQRAKHLALRQVDPMAEWQAMRAQATALVQSGFLPKAINTPEKAIAVMQTGKELGIGPMQALRCISIIDGKPVMGAELIAGLVLARVPGAVLQPQEMTNDRCVVVACRPGGKPLQVVWTRQDAQQAGLLGKSNWKGYPRAMLRNRAITEAARAVFPDATMGMYDPDELGAVTSESGEIIEMPPVPPAGRALTERRAAPSAPNPDGYKAAAEAIAKASSREELDKIAGRIGKTKLSEDERTRLQELLAIREEELEQAADDLIGGGAREGDGDNELSRDDVYPGREPGED